MKKNLKKALALLLGTMMTVGLIAGCGGSGSTESQSAGNTESINETGGAEGVVADTSEHVDLKMYLIGDRSADFDEVYGEVNKILEEKLNCSISVDFLS